MNISIQLLYTKHACNLTNCHLKFIRFGRCCISVKDGHGGQDFYSRKATIIGEKAQITRRRRDCYYYYKQLYAGKMHRHLR
jgi:hypothetical protein